MSYFLWVEDFAETDVASTVESVFGDIILESADLSKLTRKMVKGFFHQQRCGVLVELTFFDALRFIREPSNLLKVDYIILDIDLQLTGFVSPNDVVYQTYTEILERYGNDKEALKKVAGYQLYVELVMNLGFPKEHILFCSNHEQYLTGIKTAFQEAKISLPKPVPSKHESDRDIIQQWIRERRNNRYVTLRRGIIEGCQLLLDQLSQNSHVIHFHHYFQKGSQTAENLRDDLRNYLETLKTFLPLREPESSAKPMLFKLFARTLAHEWETSANPGQYQGTNSTFYQALGWILKSTRNWLSHSQILDGLQEEEVAFLFLTAMRAMFNLGNQPETYEKILFRLFQPTAATELQQDLKDKLVESYVMVKEHLLNAVKVEDAIPFNKMLDNMQNKDVSLPGNYSYLTGLFQMFWHGLSPASLNRITPKPPVTKTGRHTVTFEINCTFGNQDFGASQPNDFLFQFACHIYQRSF